MSGPVGRESILTVDEADLASSLALSRYESMLQARDEEPIDGGDSSTEAELAIVAAAWRQALAFVMMRRAVFQGNLGAG